MNWFDTTDAPHSELLWRSVTKSYTTTAAISFYPLPPRLAVYLTLEIHAQHSLLESFFRLWGMFMRRMREVGMKLGGDSESLSQAVSHFGLNPTAPLLSTVAPPV